jgi:acyl transferase domain-containing protein
VQSTIWPTPGLRRTSINSFGYGGSNAHLVLDDAYHYLKGHDLSGYHHCTVVPSIENASVVNGATNLSKTGHPNDARVNFEGPKLLIWSAADKGAIQRMIGNYHEYYKAHVAGDNGTLDQLAYTLAERRSVMPWRTFAVVENSEEILSLTEAVRAPNGQPRTAYIFTGQGAQYTGMGLELLKYPAFQESLQKSQRILDSLGSEWLIIGKFPISSLECEPSWFSDTL